MIAGYIVSLILISSGMVFYEYVTSEKVWLSHEIQPKSVEYDIGDIIYFQSHLEIRREISALRWRHTLRCRPLGSSIPFEHTSTYEGESLGSKPNVLDIEWPYFVNGRFDPDGQPSKPSVCFLRTQTSAITPLLKLPKTVNQDTYSLYIK